MKECAFIAYYLHWAHDDVMSLSHRDRRMWCREVSRINQELSGEPDNIFAKL